MTRSIDRASTLSVVAGRTDTRPRLRGRIHLWSGVGAVVPGIVLVATAGATVSAAAAVSTAVYMATVLGLFGTSAAYHVARWTSARTRARMNQADHAMIFVFIAGTYTPITVLSMPRTLGLTLLAVAWVGAAAGVALTLWHPRGTRWGVLPLYLTLGWVAVFALPDLLDRGGAAALTLIVGGGLIYTVGAIGFATGRPRGWPTTFGFHEYFHAATVVAALCHYVAIWLLLYR